MNTPDYSKVSLPSTSKFFVAALAIVSLAVACGSDGQSVNAAGGEPTDGTTADAPEPVTGSTTAVEQPEQSETTKATVDSAGTTEGAWVTTAEDLTSFQPLNDGTATVDPSDTAQVVVSFSTASAPCAGGRARAVESGEVVQVFIEAGLHPNVAAMSCVAEQVQHELTLPLNAPLGNRVIQRVTALDDQ